METWLKWLTLVFLTATAALEASALEASTLETSALEASALEASVPVPVVLDEKQHKVEVRSGSSFTLHCRVWTEALGRVRVAWYFNPSSFTDGPKLHEVVLNKSKTSTVAPNQTKHDLMDEEEGTLAKYTLSDATERHSGWYFCSVKVEIPLLNCSNSSGTEVIITKSNEVTTYPSLPVVTAAESGHFSPVDLWMWVALGVSAVVLVVLLLVWVLLRRGRCRRTVEDPIYINTRPMANKHPSPRPATDNLKMVSSCHYPRNPSPRRKPHGDKQRYKE